MPESVTVLNDPNWMPDTTWPLVSTNGAGAGVVSTNPPAITWRTWYAAPPGSGPRLVKVNAPVRSVVVVATTCPVFMFSSWMVAARSPVSVPSATPLPFTSSNAIPLTVAAWTAPNDRAGGGMFSPLVGANGAGSAAVSTNPAG